MEKPIKGLKRLPPDCKPLRPTLADIFGSKVSEEELQQNDDVKEILKVSLESRGLAALPPGAPTELVNYVRGCESSTPYNTCYTRMIHDEVH